MDELICHIIGHIHTDFPTKFGVPRQSGLVPELLSYVDFTPEYARGDALRGLDGFSHLWLLWHFSQLKRPDGADWSPTVRPPRLGGNTRMGVFATRSPYRPNPIGLSCVKLERIQWDVPGGPRIWVSGADLMDGTPILDIKPYLAYADSHPEALQGFVSDLGDTVLQVILPEERPDDLTPEQWNGLRAVLSRDPRPRYQQDPDRVYGMPFAGRDIRFRVEGDTLTVLSVEKA